MMTRDEILREMGLWPIWRLRNPDAASSAEANQEVTAEPRADTAVAGLTCAAADAGETAAHFPVADLSNVDWPELKNLVRTCKACGLCTQRKQTVFGIGEKTADWLFIGEGPGVEEDEHGEPFVGPAGHLLDAMLAAISLDRQRAVYIANAVKCRPPGNRTPSDEEIASCRPYLARQIALIRPKLIVVLGRAAAKSLLGRDEKLGSMRGEVFEYQGIPVVVTYHPAYYLRSPLDKSRAWEDLCRARTLMQALLTGQQHE